MNARPWRQIRQSTNIPFEWSKKKRCVVDFRKKKYYGKMCKNVAKDQLTNDIFKLKQKHTIRTTAKSKNKQTSGQKRIIITFVQPK